MDPPVSSVTAMPCRDREGESPDEPRAVHRRTTTVAAKREARARLIAGSWRVRKPSGNIFPCMAPLPLRARDEPRQGRQSLAWHGSAKDTEQAMQV
jgi:hypothetical protein